MANGDEAVGSTDGIPGPADPAESAAMTTSRFRGHPGVGDWRGTSVGVEAVFRARSFAEAAQLLPAVVAAAASADLRPDVDLRPEAVIVRVPAADDGALPDGAPVFAADVSEAAAGVGLVADPAAVQSVNVYVAQHSETDARPFFTAVLGYRDVGDSDAADPLRRGPVLAFNPIRDDRPGRGRTHLDVFVPADQAAARVTAAVAAGGRLVDDANAPAWWTLASPDNHGVDIAAWTDGAS